MCTAITYQGKHHYFGRNLDLEYRFNEEVVITPKNYEFKFKNGDVLKTKYSMIGMATVIGEYPLYAEATNEKGLSLAGLYFPGSAKFFEEKEGKLNLTPYELFPYFLGKYAKISEFKEELKELNLTNIPFASGMPVAELHWIIDDGVECIVLEQTEDGLKVYNNDVGVLTNNPNFEYHRTNLINYLNLSNTRGENTFSKNVELKAYGQGMSAIGLPGDCSPASRFVRAAFNKLNSTSFDTEEECVSQFFHILDSVAMVNGATVTPEGKNDITTYSSCINTNEGIYYYKTYYNNRINAIRLTEDAKKKDVLTRFKLIEKQQFNYQN